MSDGLVLTLGKQTVMTGEELKASIAITYTGRFDSLVINSQIENSSHFFTYIAINGKKSKHPHARLSLFKSELGEARIIEFVAITQHIPAGESSVAKFRASLIQEHKEIAADIARIKVVKPPT